MEKNYQKDGNNYERVLKVARNFKHICTHVWYLNTFYYRGKIIKG